MMKKEEEKFAPSDVFEGIVSLRAVIETIEAGESDRKIKEVLLDGARAEKKEREFAYIRAKGKTLDFPVRITERAEIDALCTGSSHGGVVALCSERHYCSLTSDALQEKGFYMMLDGIEDPYNFGYSVRSVYASGADGIIVPPRNWMSAAGVVCRASAGASERARILTAEPEEAARIAHGRGWRVVCADKNDAVSVYESDLHAPLLLIVGGEKRGISRAVLDTADAVVCLDYGRDFRAALSAASASAILAFEVLRQNRK